MSYDDVDIAFVSFGFASVSLESKSDLVIGIDFGTTYTGVAFAHSAKAKGTDAARIAENVEVIRKWPNVSSSFSEKIPTLISYHTSPPTWGGNVRIRDEPQVAYFKLGLQPGIGSHYLRSMHNPPSALPFLEPNWKHPKLPNKTALDFASDYLRGVHTFVKDVYLKQQFGNLFLQNQSIEYVITVPAIWKDSAKALTRQAAIRAGIPERKLELVTEPEAAALYCATMCTEVDLCDGDCFLVCDAGGGTVDLISYEVLSRSPFSIDECNVGSGAPCGAVYLNKGFESLLRRKLGDKANAVLTPNRLREAMRYFDTTVKTSFNPCNEACEPDFDVPLPGAPDTPEINLEDGFLKLSRDDLDSVYRRIFDRIFDLINNQISDVRTKHHKKLKLMFLVGGLGTNAYLLQFLEKNLRGQIEVKQPASGVSAIMRGAVLHKLGLNVVRERLMRRHYGVQFNRAGFKPGKDPAHLKGYDLAGNVICKNAMRWYAHKRQKMPNGEAKKFSFSTKFTEAEYEAYGPLETHACLSSCESDNAPDFDDNTGVVDLCTLTVDVSSLKPLERRFGSRGFYYEVTYELAVLFGPELVFGLLRNGKVMGSVVAKYT